MKKLIKIAASRTTTNHYEREIDLPETAMFYMKHDDSRFFGVGVILFAIIPKYPNQFENLKSFRLVRVERNKQDYNDFVPHEDCQSEFWLKGGTLRHEALDIILSPTSHNGFEVITEEQFEKIRMELLNDYKKID